MVQGTKCLQEWRLQILNQLATCTRNILYSKHGSKVKKLHLSNLFFGIYSIYINCLFRLENLRNILW